MTRWNVPMALGFVGGLGKESKMPAGVHSWGFGREHCSRGRELARIIGSVCEVCYAAGGNFRFANVKAALERRRQAYLDDPDGWASAMAYLIRAMSPHYFRWFSAGDIQDVAMLDSINRVAKRTRHTAHWLPTHEPGIVADYGVKALSRNLVVRISADYIEDRPNCDTLGLGTHTVHRWPGEPVPAATGNRKHSLECQAFRRGNNCGTCRACWEPGERIPNTSFLFHGPSAPRHKELQRG